MYILKFQYFLDFNKSIEFERKMDHIIITGYKINNSWIAGTNKKG